MMGDLVVGFAFAGHRGDVLDHLCDNQELGSVE
jgi:hypothetical protein